MSYFDSSDISTVQDEEDVILEVLNYLMIDAFLHALHFFFFFGLYREANCIKL